MTRERAFQHLGQAIAALAAAGVTIRHADESEFKPREILDEIDTALMHVKAALEDAGLDDEIPASAFPVKYVYVRALLENS